MSVSLTITRKGESKFRENAKELGEAKAVKVGVLAGTGVHTGSDATVAQIAWWDEFGTTRIPERPFLRTTMRENRQKYSRILQGAIVKILKGKLTSDRALKALGLKATADIQATIVAIQDPPNAQSTIDRKGSSNPLIDKGQLRQSIHWALVKRGE